jgi:murein DD-endopeptidase MepM/ murein hydrolase activator NlpD
MKPRIPIRKFLSSLLRYVVSTASLSVVFYILFALFFSTKEERQLQRENNLYRSRYEQMKEKERLIGDVVEGLLDKDDAIYEELFETQAPSLDALTAADLIAESDSLSESFYLSSAASTAESTMAMAANVDANFAAIFDLLEQRRDSIPPLTQPLKDMSYVQAGASVGEKQNPVYKLPMTHNGLDLIAAQGTDVFAAAGGIVSKVIRSRRGLGNVVEINHRNGYTTRYCLLADIKVSNGQRIRRGQKVGTVGISSSYPTPHLHFEVSYKGEIKDPVNYLFASLSPEEYSRLVFMTTATSQSLD